jgi:predicted transcriptional regulator
VLLAAFSPVPDGDSGKVVDATSCDGTVDVWRVVGELDRVPDVVRDSDASVAEVDAERSVVLDLVASTGVGSSLACNDDLRFWKPEGSGPAEVVMPVKPPGAPMLSGMVTDIDI